jgi:hypothetical protein
MMAVPFFYNHRMNDGVFVGGLLAFVAPPVLAGTCQKQAERSITQLAVILLLLCPLVYAVTDRLDVQFEKLRDGFFLGTGSTIIFVSAERLNSSYRSRRWLHAVAAASSLASATVAVFVLLWFVMYLE